MLEWADTKNVGWGVLLILGGGFALAAGMRKSGLTSAIAVLLSGLRDTHPLLILLIVVTCITFMTELMSNVAVANLLLPVLAATAVAAGQNPLLLMTPATIACSFAFMLPVRSYLLFRDCISLYAFVCATVFSCARRLLRRPMPLLRRRGTYVWATWPVSV